MQSRVQRVPVAFAESLKSSLEALLIAAEETHLLPRVLVGVIVILGAQQIHGQGRNNGARPHVRSQHREAHRLRKRHEQEFGHTGKEKHGNEYDANAQRGDERGHSNLLRAVENRLDRFLAHGQVAIDVFDFHRRVIHQDADGQSQAAQSHDVDGLAQSAETKNAHKNGQGNGDGNDQGALPVAKEEQNHDGSEAGGDQRFTQHALDGCADIKRLIKEHVHA